MTIMIEAPTMGESITEATIAVWHKQAGDAVAEDEVVAELETDKVNLEVVAPAAGVLSNIMKGEGDTVIVGEAMAEISTDGSTTAADNAAVAAPEASAAPEAPVVAPTEAANMIGSAAVPEAAAESTFDGPLSPAVKKLVEENNIDPNLIKGTGKDGRLTKGDVLAYLENPVSVMPSVKNVEAPAVQKAPVVEVGTSVGTDEKARSTRVKMTKLRQTIAGRLKTAQNNAAMLTTYNEVDMTAVMEIRKKYKDAFLDKHGVKLGFMSFFTKAVIEGLKAWPALNAEIDGDEIVYKNYYNMGIAVSSDKGLVVPVLKDADQMSFADIEQGIMDAALKARDGKLTPSDMTGGTYTITNGGTFGSLMSMPILNYPQVGILGMHNIVQRPMVVDGEIKARPMMFLAMTYDHRIVDGREAVSFLVKVKESLENPEKMLLEI